MIARCASKWPRHLKERSPIWRANASSTRASRRASNRVISLAGWTPQWSRSWHASTAKPCPSRPPRPDMGHLAFFAVPVVGAVARSILGPKLGALATGGAVGALAMVITASFLIAGLAGLGGLLGP